jgi:hypothetical protein
MMEIMFDHNLQFKEFVYIFEDFWNYADPHTERIMRNLGEAEEIRDRLHVLFKEDLEVLQDSLIPQVVDDYVTHLKKDIEPKNGGFPNTESMFTELYRAVKFRFDNEAQKNFDQVSDKYVAQFREGLQEKVELDPETREWMRKRIEEEEKRAWMHANQAEHPAEIDLKVHTYKEEMEKFIRIQEHGW